MLSDEEHESETISVFLRFIWNEQSITRYAKKIKYLRQRIDRSKMEKTRHNRWWIEDTTDDESKRQDTTEDKGKENIYNGYIKRKEGNI